MRLHLMSKIFPDNQRFLNVMGYWVGDIWKTLGVMWHGVP